MRLAVLFVLLAAPATAQSVAVSEENPPFSCPSGHYISSLICSGDFCDNLNLRCTESDMAPGGTFWTEFFEADGRTSGACRRSDVAYSEPYFPIMTGVACRGGNCDDIAMECTTFPGLALDMGRCTTIRHSDETGRGFMPPGFAIAEIACSGRHCDNLDVTICPLIAE